MKNKKEITVKKLAKLLSEGEVNFSFTKKDGTERIVKATLNENLIPKNHLPKEDTKKVNGSNQKFYDLDKNEWRSLSYDTKKVTLLN